MLKADPSPLKLTISAGYTSYKYHKIYKIPKILILRPNNARVVLAYSPNMQMNLAISHLNLHASVPFK
jgi:hypothetical protein